MNRKKSWTVLAVFLLAAAVLSQWIQAAEITVDGTTCTLADAITTANSPAGTASGGCSAGDSADGADTLNVTADITLATALPQISSTITIEGGTHSISGNNDPDVGSVLHITASGNLTLNEITVTGGNTENDGGGIYNDGGTVTLSNCTVSGNTPVNGDAVPTRGGGIFNFFGTVTLTDSMVNGNTSGYWGGGIFNLGGSLTLTDVTVSGNTANGGGGGIFNYDGTATLTNATISGNKGSSNTGSGISNLEGSLTLTNSTVSGNMAEFVGGIFNTGTLTMISSTVSDNTAEENIGGIANDTGTATLTNSTVSNNTAEAAVGGISNVDGSLTLTNSTVTNNTAVGAFGGILNYGFQEGADATLTLTGSLISGNTASSEANEVYNENGAINAGSYNVFGHSDETTAGAFGGFTPGGSDVNATSDGDGVSTSIPTALSAILSPLADNGGPTKTHALVPGSPALDLDTTCSTGLDTDQRGYPRPETVGTGCDAGAFEGSVSIVKNTAFLPAVYLLLLNQ